MEVCIIDADLIGRKSHRFPNLAAMKLGGYHESKCDRVKLKLNYENLESFDLVYISKVFTDTKVPEEILKYNNVRYGGTGFFYDKAPPLPYEIEHHMPSYKLYDDWVKTQIKEKLKNMEEHKKRTLTNKEIKEAKKEYEYYTDYSIGFTTKKCFRGCEFCVNKNYHSVELHSPLEEFLDTTKKYICLLDDNLLGYSGWKSIIRNLQITNKPFQYKQGLDERLLTKEKTEILTQSKYKGDYIFAFDNIKDEDLIKDKLELWKQYCKKTTKLYVLCGFDRNNKYDNDFWLQDVIDTFRRIKLLMIYGCLPYIMRFKRYEESPLKGTYINLARWCNQPNFFKKKSYREFCLVNGKDSASVRYMNEFERAYPKIAIMFFDLKFEQLNKYKINKRFETHSNEDFHIEC